MILTFEHRTHFSRPFNARPSNEGLLPAACVARLIRGRVRFSSAQCCLRSSAVSHTACVALQSLRKPKPEAFARRREQLEKTSGKTQHVVLKTGSSEDDEVGSSFVGLVYSGFFFFSFLCLRASEFS